jgi:hypothetical protein
MSKYSRYAGVVVLSLGLLFSNNITPGITAVLALPPHYHAFIQESMFASLIACDTVILRGGYERNKDHALDNFLLCYDN